MARVCANCGHRLGRKDKFCGECGSSDITETASVFGFEIAPKTKKCIYCGETLEGKAKFCWKCGKPTEGGIDLSFLDRKGSDYVAPDSIVGADNQTSGMQKSAAPVQTSQASAQPLPELDFLKSPEDFSSSLGGDAEINLNSSSRLSSASNKKEENQYVQPAAAVWSLPQEDTHPQNPTGAPVQNNVTETVAPVVAPVQSPQMTVTPVSQQIQPAPVRSAAPVPAVNISAAKDNKDAKEVAKDVSKDALIEAAAEAEKKAAEEAARKAEEEKKRAEEAARKAEEEKKRAAEEAERKAEEERKAAEEAARKAEEEKKRAEEEAARKAEEERKAAEEAARKAEEEKKRAEEEAARKAEEEKKRAEEEAARKAEEERKAAEEAARKAEEERKRAEEEAARKAEEERKAAEEAARKAEEERKRAEEEAARKAEEERKAAEEAARIAEEERKREEELKKLEEMRAGADKDAAKAIKAMKAGAHEGKGSLEAVLDRYHEYENKSGVKMSEEADNSCFIDVEDLLGVHYYEENAFKLAFPLLKDAAEHGRGASGLCYSEYILRNRTELPDEPECLKNILEMTLEDEELMKDDSKKIRALLALAKVYKDGVSVEKDMAKAFECYKESAELGSPKGIAMVGRCYLYGDGVKRDPKEAFAWNLKGAEAGEETGIRNLAVAYDYGTGVKRDPRAAVEWYKKLLSLISNDRFAKYRIAYCLSNPDRLVGYKPDDDMYREAYDYASQALEEGEKDAEYVIGYLRTLPINGGPNYTEAYSHFAKAANNGNNKAREWMGKFTKHGNGTYSLKSV
ncbi:MAG: zinc ribbon domain-containing protein [Lachnospiraceae bacterium]|nr:zinc ribbon domain-containing protein [Lachnospiraceae bacterium]